MRIRRIGEQTSTVQSLTVTLLSPGRKSKIAFVEVKRHGEKPRPLQEARHGLLRRLGFAVYVLDDGAQTGEILEQIGGGAE